MKTVMMEARKPMWMGRRLAERVSFIGMVLPCSSSRCAIGQITACTARRATVRRLRSSIDVCVGRRRKWNQSKHARKRFHDPVPSSERIDVIEDSDLPQQHAADDMTDADMIGEDRRRSSGACGQRSRKLLIIELD